MKIELTKEEHKMITAIFMMHRVGMIIPIHNDKRPLLNKIVEDFNLRDIRESIK